MTDPNFTHRSHGAPGVSYGQYIGYNANQYYGNAMHYPYYPYYNQVTQQYQPGNMYGTPYNQNRPGYASGCQRRPNQIGAQPNNRHSSRFSCEPCNMVFESNNSLSEHIDELHVSCEVEGCSYSAPLDLMTVHSLKHVKNEKGELVLESAEETMKWIENRRNRHPSNRNRNMSAIADSTLERLLREAHRRTKTEAPIKNVLYPVISKLRDRPSALLHLTDPLKYQNLVRQSSGPYSYRPSLSIGRGVCLAYKRARSCKFGDSCQYSHDLKGTSCKALSVSKRPPVMLHLLKKDIYNAEKTLICAIRTIVMLNFFDDENMKAIEEADTVDKQ